MTWIRTLRHAFAIIFKSEIKVSIHLYHAFLVDLFTHNCQPFILINTLYGSIAIWQHWLYAYLNGIFVMFSCFYREAYYGGTLNGLTWTIAYLRLLIANKYLEWYQSLYQCSFWRSCLSEKKGEGHRCNRLANLVLIVPFWSFIFTLTGTFCYFLCKKVH